MRREKPEERDNRLQDARETLSSFLKRRGLRATRQRDTVLEALFRVDAHVSVDELYDLVRRRNPSIGHATIYRCMSLFVEAGIANERRFDEGRVRYEPGVNVQHHDHLVCLECGEIQEFEDPTIEEIQQEITGKRGFQVRYHRLVLYGHCTNCRAAESSEPAG